MKDNNSLKFHKMSVWSDLAHLRKQKIPSDLREVILGRDSLTAKVKGLCVGLFEVRVISQQWQRPMHEECVALGIKPGEIAMVRQVCLCCSGVPWIFARSVVPIKTYRNYKRLGFLGSKPLGELLFRERSMRRAGMEVAFLKQGQPLHSYVSRGLTEASTDGTYWARRSVFSVKGRPLLVCEVFLPDFGGLSSCK